MLKIKFAACYGEIIVHNKYIGDEELSSHWNDLDGIIPMNIETIVVHINRLKEDGFIICDEEIRYDDSRLINLPLKTIAKNAGNSKAFGNVALGALFKLYDLEYFKQL